MQFSDIYQSYHRMPEGLEDRYGKLPALFDMKAEADGFDLYLYDVIGCDCCEPDDVASALAMADGAPIRLRMNSPGGDAFAGFAIHNLLAAYDGEVTAVVDGVCASAASYIAMAAGTVEMQPHSFLMIHNGWTVSVGDKNKLAAQISALQRIDKAQAKIFSGRTGITQDEIAAMLDAETWLDAEEAVDQGFADAITGSKTAADDTASARFGQMETAIQQVLHELERESRAFTFDKRKRQLSARLLKRQLHTAY